MTITWEAIAALSGLGAGVVAAFWAVMQSLMRTQTAELRMAVAEAVEDSRKELQKEIGALRVETGQVLTQFAAQKAQFEMLRIELDRIKQWIEEHEERLRSVEVRCAVEHGGQKH